MKLKKKGHIITFSCPESNIEDHKNIELVRSYADRTGCTFSSLVLKALAMYCKDNKNDLENRNF